MVTVQLIDTGQVLEATNEQVTFVKKSGDLGDITTINSSYTWSMKFPKTPNNTQTLQGLGLVGSGSLSPYQKIYVNLLDNGFPVVLNGLLNVRETSKDYGIYIQEGFVDFLKDVKTDTVGANLDLSELDHLRDYNTIVDSYELDLPYKYLLAAVNGAYLPNISDTTNLSLVYMIPYANVGYIWDLIFSTYGWTFSFNNDVRDSMDETWMSYPSEIVYDDSNLVVVVDGDITTTQSSEVGNGESYDILFDSQTVDNDYMTQSGRTWIVNQNGNYKISLFTTGVVKKGLIGPVFNDYYYEDIYVNGSLRQRGNQSDSSDVYETQVFLYQGDIVKIVATPNGYLNYTSVFVYTGEIEIGYLDLNEISFTQALIKLKISDFIKEVMIRESLTAFVDSVNRNVVFKTFDERLDAGVLDWSQYFKERTKETYLYQSYAQKNWLRHKYDNDIDDFNDGQLNVVNDNIEQEKDLYRSFSFSPDDVLRTWESANTEYQVPLLRMFEIETETDTVTGDLIFTYKRLKDRFYFVKEHTPNMDVYIDGNLRSNNSPYVSLAGSTFVQIANTKYGRFNEISDTAKVHEIDLALPLSEVLRLDMTKRYYFSQEAGIYILNSLSWKSGNINKGTFIRLN